MCAHRSTKSLALTFRISGIIFGAIDVLLPCVFFPPDASCQLRSEEKGAILLAKEARDRSNMPVTKATGTKDLIWALENHKKYPNLRRRAAEILGERGTTEAIPHLLNALRDPEMKVQKAAAEALTKTGDEKLFDELIENLNSQINGNRPRVRRYSAYVLGQLAKGKDQREIPEVIEALEKRAKDKDKLVREEAVYALSEICSSSSKSIFIEGMKDEHHAVRRHSANALAKIRGAEAEEALADAYGKETDRKTRLTIAAALSGFGTSRALEVLVETLHKEPTSVRVDIAAKLSESGTPEAAAILADLLVDDISPHVRTTAAQGLMAIGDPSAVPALAEALREDRVPSVRVAASEALINLADSSITNDLLDAMLDTNEEVAENSARALVRLRDTDIVPDLMRMLDSDNGSVVGLATAVLQDLTYKPYGNNVKMWKSWYDENYKVDDQ